MNHELQRLLFAIGIPVLSGAILTFIFFICRKAGKFFTSVNEAIKDIESMKINGNLRKEESIINLEGMFIMMDAMKNGKMNGNVEDLRERYRTYLNKKAVG